jgi:hypothetical protein
MQRESSAAAKSGSTKTGFSAAGPALTLGSAAVKDKSAGTKYPESSSISPPVWARYIDSRLKQFCTR